MDQSVVSNFSFQKSRSWEDSRLTLFQGRSGTCRKLWIQIVEQCLPSLLGFPMLCSTSGQLSWKCSTCARNAAAYRSSTAGAAKSHMIAAVRKTRQHASHVTIESGPGTPCTSKILCCPGNVTQISSSWQGAGHMGATLRNLIPAQVNEWTWKVDSSDPLPQLLRTARSSLKISGETLSTSLSDAFKHRRDLDLE